MCGHIFPASVKTRADIAIRKCKELNIELNDYVVEYLASNICSNIGYIEGSIKTLKLHSENNHKQITLDEAAYLLANQFKTLIFHKILVCRGFNFTALI